MDMNMIILSFTTTVVIGLSLLASTLAKDDEKPLQPCRGQQVCATLMKYKDGTVTDEGDYCECVDGTSCSRKWDEKDTASLTWQHYERAHWSVQYKFCRPVFSLDKQPCNPNEMGAEVTTSVSEWAPHLEKPRCRCPRNDLYRIKGWKRKGQVWEYTYDCDKINCSNTPTDSAECARIFLDPSKKTDKVTEMEFLCSCPEGEMCPAKYYDKKDSGLVQSDDSGNHFITKSCEPVVKRKRST